MRAFHLVRNTDVSQVSGTGVVAEGVLWTDGTVALRWLGSRPTTALHDNIQSVESIHGHEGATVVEFIDVLAPTEEEKVALYERTDIDPVEYFGAPGHCYDIDGDWWHVPGECKDPGHGTGGKQPCCGVVTQ